MRLTNGTRLGPYEIVSSIGAGGMGQVYRAHDATLGRDVALKVLHPDATADPARLERFTREARAIAALNHPHIVTIFSTEESEGVRFLTMELVEGVPLDAIIPPRGLPAERLVEVALQLADAIAAAHERGITHRDLKPANVMLDRSGRVKVLDFGLAKVINATAGALDHTQLNLSREGVVVGTIPYMSPEQIEGKLVDHRTDIFSFGVLLHELATGERPFQGGSPAALMSAILRDAPPSLTIRRPDLSESVDRVIRRCLEKDPRDRYQSVGEIQREIQRPSRATETRRAAAPKDEALSLTVMPFKARAGDPVAEALAGGLTEDVGTGVARFSYLNVVNPTEDVNHGARYVLDGRVRTAGPTVRVSAELVDTTTGASLWAETYTRETTSAGTFGLQDDVSGRIVATVADSNGVLTRAMSVVARSKAVPSPYEAVLRGLGYWQLGTPEEHAEVRDCLEKAVEQAPDYADGWGSLALMYIEEHKHGFNARPDPFGRAQAAIRRALALDAANQFAYHALAQASFFQHDLSAFVPVADRAIALNPLDGSTVAYMGILIAYSGDWERGVEIADRAINLNPHHPGWYRFASFYNCYRKGADADALEIGQRLAMGMPTYYYSHLALAVAHAQLGHLGAARAALAEAVRLVPDFAAALPAEMEKWQHWNPDLRARITDGLRKAGLEGVTEPAPAEPVRIRRHRTALIAGALMLAGAIGATVWSSLQSAQPEFTSATIDVQALTLNGHAGDAAISPDGKFIAYVRVDGIKNSVWVKQIASNSDIEILPYVRGRAYWAPSVTPDGAYVDVIGAEPQWQTAAYRLPFLGGTPRLLLRGITSGIGWSQDGRHMAFVRVTGDGATSLVIADPDGANERVVASRRPPDMFVNIFYSGQPPNRPSWSLDGRTIGLVGASMDAARLDAGELIEIDVQSGVERQVRRLGIRTWGIEMAFLSNERVLVSEAGENTAHSLRIWESRAVAGTPLTRDLASFRNISLTADRSSGVATRTVARSAIWIGPVSGGDFRQVISEGPDRPGDGSLDAAGNLTYRVTMPSGRRAVFRRAKDAGSSTLVLDDADDPLVSADGRQVFVNRHTASPGLYRLDVDGTNLTLLVEDASVNNPVITPDGHNIVYMSNKQGTQQPWMVPTAGGAPRRLAEVFLTSAMAISPDGARVLFTSAGGSGTPTRLCDFPTFQNCRDTPVWPGEWLADNRTIVFGDPNDPKNLVSQFVDGGPVRSITRFTDKNAAWFALSPDRRTLVLTRSGALSDAVLISGLK